MTNKEFNLSEERETVKKILKGVYTEHTEHRIIELIFGNIETQDKEFIKILKENLWKHKGTFEGVKCKTCLPLDWVEDEIDKLAGNELI